MEILSRIGAWLPLPRSSNRRKKTWRARPALEALEALEMLSGQAVLGGPAATLATNGVYVLTALNVAAPAAILANPNVDGIALRATWAALEPADGTFDWSYLDTQLAAASKAGKKLSISVMAGVFSPSWVYWDGAKSFTFVDNTTPQTQILPVPWDPIYLTKWTQFIAAMGQRYDANPTVTHVKVTGINSTTPETLLPESTGIPVGSGKNTWTTTDDVADWRAAGYTRLKIEQAWTTITSAYAQAFASKQMAMEMVGQGLPPIDDKGRVIPNAPGDGIGVAGLFNQAIATYGSQFILQNDGLCDFWICKNEVKRAGQVSTAYQMLWFSTSDPSYQMNNGTPTDAHTSLQTAVDRGIAGNAHYLELYPSDVLNRALQDVVARAHTGLKKNAVPVASIANLPASGHTPAQTALTLAGSVADPTSGDPASLVYAWSVTRNGKVVASGSDSSLSFAPADAGVYTVNLTVTDKSGLTSPVDTTTFTVDKTIKTNTGWIPSAVNVAAVEMVFANLGNQKQKDANAGA